MKFLVFRFCLIQSNSHISSVMFPTSPVTASTLSSDNETFHMAALTPRLLFLSETSTHYKPRYVSLWNTFQSSISSYHTFLKSSILSPFARSSNSISHLEECPIYIMAPELHRSGPVVWAGRTAVWFLNNTPFYWCSQNATAFRLPRLVACVKFTIT